MAVSPLSPSARQRQLEEQLRIALAEGDQSQISFLSTLVVHRQGLAALEKLLQKLNPSTVEAGVVEAGGVETPSMQQLRGWLPSWDGPVAKAS
jgi:hypothetical protein